MCTDTDDTDELLLIPPDFFLVDSEAHPPYFTIVDRLIKQVSDLQFRIENIESTSDVNLIGKYLEENSWISQESTMSSSEHGPQKHFISQNSIYQPRSTQSTPQKPVTNKFKLSSLPNSPNLNNGGRILKPSHKDGTRKPIKEQDENSHSFGEIDAFISNAKTIQRNHTIRSLENEFDATAQNGKIRNHQETAELLEKPSQNQLEQNNDITIRQNAWKCGDDGKSVPDYGFGVRDAIHPVSTKLQQSMPNPDFQSLPVNYENSIGCSSNSSSSDSISQVTAYDKYKKNKTDKKYRNSNDKEENRLLKDDRLHLNALDVLHMHKKYLGKSETVMTKDRLQKNSKHTNVDLPEFFDLLRLSDIWGSTHLDTQSPSKIAQKLLEEKLRRQHCEQLIQELQKKNVELQQKMAVAVKIDESKNDAIRQFKNAFDQIQCHFNKLKDEKLLWENEMTRLKNQHSFEIEAANQKAIYYEKEASKALNLAHSNQEKVGCLEQQSSQLQNQLKSVENKFREVDGNYQKEFEKNKVLADIVSQKEIELQENKSVLNNARDEVAQSRKAVELCQAEFAALKNDCSKLESDLKDEKNLVLNLTEQKRKLLNEIQTYKTNEKILKDSLEQSKSKLESTKVELRNFYQGQLEIIVENKRKEMQTQLDQEKNNNLDEMRKKEMSMAKTAAVHIKEVTEKCALEIKLLEEKHQEEIRLYHIQMSQYKKEIDSLQAKLAMLPEKRAAIAKQLQKVMEAQWSEALKMIGNSPASMSSNELQPVLPNQNLVTSTYSTLTEDGEQLHQRFLKKMESGDHTSDYDETPVSSRTQKKSESEIQKYINMLLNRVPGQPTNEEPQQRASWHHGEDENHICHDPPIKSSKERKLGKPPWK